MNDKTKRTKKNNHKKTRWRKAHSVRNVYVILYINGMLDVVQMCVYCVQLGCIGTGIGAKNADVPIPGSKSKNKKFQFLLEENHTFRSDRSRFKVPSDAIFHHKKFDALECNTVVHDHVCCCSCYYYCRCCQIFVRFSFRNHFKIGLIRFFFSSFM